MLCLFEQKYSKYNILLFEIYFCNNVKYLQSLLHSLMHPYWIEVLNLTDSKLLNVLKLYFILNFYILKEKKIVNSTSTTLFQ